jgi:hypothetical protein
VNRSTNRSSISAPTGPRRRGALSTAVAALGAVLVALATSSVAPAKADAADWESFPVTINNRSDLTLYSVADARRTIADFRWDGPATPVLVPGGNRYVPVGTAVQTALIVRDRSRLTARYWALLQGRDVYLDLRVGASDAPAASCTLLFKDETPVSTHRCEALMLIGLAKDPYPGGWRRQPREVRFTITG